MKDDRIQIRVDAETKKLLKEAAEKDGRTVSNYILRLIESDLKSKKEKADGRC